MGRSTDYEVRLRGRELEGCLEGLAADVVPVAVGFGSILASLVLKVYP